MISLTHVLCHQDFSNLNKSPGGSYQAPGGPMTSPPVYRTHGGDLSPRPATPTSPSTLRTQSPVLMNLSPSSRFNLTFTDGGIKSPSAGYSGKFLDPELLINKSPSELPQGVDPSQREVGAVLWIWCTAQKHGSHSVQDVNNCVNAASMDVLVNWPPCWRVILQNSCFLLLILISLFDIEYLHKIQKHPNTQLVKLFKSVDSREAFV